MLRMADRSSAGHVVMVVGDLPVLSAGCPDETRPVAVDGRLRVSSR